MTKVLTTPTRKRVLKPATSATRNARRLRLNDTDPQEGTETPQCLAGREAFESLNDTDPQEGTETKLIAVDVVVTPGLNDTDPQEGTETDGRRLAITRRRGS